MPGPIWDSERMGDKPNWKPEPDPEEKDSRDGMPARRCQTHNQLMECVGLVGRSLAYYCAVSNSIQIRAV